MTFPTPYTVTYTPYTGTTRDAMDNDVPAYGDTVNLPAYGWGPHRSKVLDNSGGDGHTGRDIAEVDLTLPPMTVNILDLFGLDSGNQYQVVGVTDLTSGFHGWKPGIVVELQRITG